MNDKVFLHYSQAELDRNFDQRGWIGVANAEAAIARYVARSEATRRVLKQQRDVAYGTDPDEVLDIFTTDTAGAPTLIFIHGGAWRNFTKDDYSFVAEVLVPDGVHVVVINFSKLPSKRLPDVIIQSAQRGRVGLATRARIRRRPREALSLRSFVGGAHERHGAAHRLERFWSASRHHQGRYLDQRIL